MPISQLYCLAHFFLCRHCFDVDLDIFVESGNICRVGLHHASLFAVEHLIRKVAVEAFACCLFNGHDLTVKIKTKVALRTCGAPFITVRILT